ncbi:holo-ACP synthase [Ralstonia solanacearum]|uniref:holo-ACP synthase n=1 Tax=Ralstonia solanacearum TaxID=305 RepID=UPI0007C8D891|nr:holo-ACP synthase [Ralstonia solanacearum]ATJ86106.1 holo-ACP synthase [Ralstonia solanacearum]AYB51989.1 holo-ACP synthase [Ralstonia solanacearum]AYB56547.1 holo-ACP synthase [Ralstonia solanacearum]OAI75421.1 4'-phosphopantetheinyl transferase [Ralstonia solanacearum]RCW11593.1 holo-ACP synthase [Ralstonia solanacearum]
MNERPAVPSVSGAIYGIGTDIIQIERVEGVMQRTEGRFAEKVLGPDELRIYHARKARSERRGLAFLATRFAAKEAVSKAIGLGMHWPMTWRALQTLNLPSGQPVVRYGGELADWIAQRGLHIQISVTDERDYAVAFAVAELLSTPSA